MLSKKCKNQHIVLHENKNIHFYGGSGRMYLMVLLNVL